MWNTRISAYWHDWIRKKISKFHKNLIKMTYFSRSSDRMFCTCSIHTGYGTIHRELLLGSGNDLINFTNLIVQWNFVKTWKPMNLFSEHVLDSVPSKFLLFIIFIDYYSQMLFLSSSIYQASFFIQLQSAQLACYFTIFSDIHRFHNSRNCCWSSLW